ncbi:diguanylate cyclase [Vibrio europaeus]|uniref:sensor domain-containing diguanylate cyclase n=1 Tax=Vibrio europaeus TaxID=300876 RepID=UPI00233F4335|nr:diguanylate cyclase [Vibrio europaeus]MDC5804023.1 diguanylate cyclase [Vibrio europaeus]MDC5829345.1 diguanylate cyclase [Vibrio europaeus]MDC5835863.1 diguanylate cyclase [Vibrio europaeus]
MQRKSVFSYLAITTLVFFSLVSFYYFKKHQQLEKDIIVQNAELAIHQLASSEREYQSVRSQFISIIELLSHSRNLYEYVLEPTKTNKGVVEEVWSSVASNQKWYTQIRFLDTNGMEKIRLNYSDGDAEVESDKNLQDKSQRNYYLYAQTLNENDIGVWGIDLEHEHGKLVEPYQPALRLITPVYVAGNRAGYLVLNIDVRYLSSRLNYSPDERFSPELIGEQGFYLAGSSLNELYGHLVKERNEHNFARTFPVTWQMMQHNKSGYLMENEGLIVFNQIYLSPQQPLYLVIELNGKELDAIAKHESEALVQEATLVFVLMLAFVIPGTLLVVHYRKRSIESQLARAALSGMSAVIISDRNHRAIMVNDQFCALTGLAHRDIQSRNIIKRLLGEEQIELSLEIFEQVAHQQLWEGEISIQRAGDERTATALLRVQSVLAKSGRVSYYITSVVDISDRKELEERLRILSERDELTQLWNRRKFELELRRNARLMERYPATSNACLALLDIDFFKRVNDELGHDEGDRVITNVAQMLESTLRETDFVARIGGEEFAIIMPHTSITEAELALDRLRIAIDLEANIPVTVSIGVTDFIADSTRCYKCADIALYESKSSGRNRVSVCFSSEEVA